MPRKILYFDCETTGLDHIKNDIIQLACIIHIDGKEVDRADFKICPFSFDNISQKAVETHGFTIADLHKFPEPKKVYKDLIYLFSKYIDRYNKQDKFYPAGYNVKFDLEFLNSFFKKCGDGYGSGTWQNWRAIDPLPFIYAANFADCLYLKNYQLATVCEHFGIKIKAHDALSDVEATIQLIKKFINPYCLYIKDKKTFAE